MSQHLDERSPSNFVLGWYFSLNFNGVCYRSIWTDGPCCSLRNGQARICQGQWKWWGDRSDDLICLIVSEVVALWVVDHILNEYSWYRSILGCIKHTRIKYFIWAIFQGNKSADVNPCVGQGDRLWLSRSCKLNGCCNLDCVWSHTDYSCVLWSSNQQLIAIHRDWDSWRECWSISISQRINDWAC